MAAQLSHGGTPLLFLGLFVEDCESKPGPSFCICMSFFGAKGQCVFMVSFCGVAGGISITGRSIGAVPYRDRGTSQTFPSAGIQSDCHGTPDATRVQTGSPLGGVHMESFRDDIIELFSTGLDQSAPFNGTRSRAAFTKHTPAGEMFNAQTYWSSGVVFH